MCTIAISNLKLSLAVGHLKKPCTFQSLKLYLSNLDSHYVLHQYVSTTTTGLGTL